MAYGNFEFPHSHFYGGSLGELIDMYKKLERRYCRLAGEFCKLKSEIARFEELTAQKLEEMSAEIHEKMEQLRSEVEKQLAEQNAWVTGQINDTQSWVTGQINKTRTYVDGEITSLRNEVNTKVSGALAEVERSITALTQQFDAFKTELDNALEAFKTTVSTQISDLQGQLNDFETRVDAKIAPVLNLGERMDTMEADFGNLRSTLNDAMTRLDNKVNERLNTFNGQLTHFRTEIDAFDGRLESAEETVNQMSETVTGFRTEIDAFKTKVENDIQAFINGVDTKITDLENEIGKKQNKRILWDTGCNIKMELIRGSFGTEFNNVANVGLPLYAYVQWLNMRTQTQRNDYSYLPVVVMGEGQENWYNYLWQSAHSEHMSDPFRQSLKFIVTKNPINPENINIKLNWTDVFHERAFGVWEKYGDPSYPISFGEVYILMEVE